MTRFILPALLLLAALAGPAAANCTETELSTAKMAPHYQRGWATLKAGPDGAYFDRLDIRADQFRMAPAFGALPPQKKEALINAAYEALYEAIPEPVRENEREQYGAVALGIGVVDALGRPLYVGSACGQGRMTFTEHARYQASFSFGDGSRSQAEPRGVRMKAVRRAFHGVVGWQATYYIAWVPEGGFFEIDVPGKADLARLKRYWPRAPKGFRYAVVANDGTPLASVQR